MTVKLGEVQFRPGTARGGDFFKRIAALFYQSHGLSTDLDITLGILQAPITLRRYDAQGFTFRCQSLEGATAYLRALTVDKAISLHSANR